jgi:hypothetical protein
MWSSLVCCFLPWALPSGSVFSMMQSTYPYAGTASPGQVSWEQVCFQAPGTVCVSTIGEQDLEQCWDHPSNGRHDWQCGPIMHNHAGYHCPNAKEVDKKQQCYQHGAPAWVCMCATVCWMWFLRVEVLGMVARSNPCWRVAKGLQGRA